MLVLKSLRNYGSALAEWHLNRLIIKLSEVVQQETVKNINGNSAAKIII